MLFGITQHRGHKNAPEAGLKTQFCGLCPLRLGHELPCGTIALMRLVVVLSLSVHPTNLWSFKFIFCF